MATALMPKRFKIVFYVLLYFLSAAASLEMLPSSLPGNLYPFKNYVTVSGEEAGGIMAQILHFTHSAYVKGVAIYSSTFYRCGTANGDLEAFKKNCTIMLGTPVNQYSVDSAIKDLESYSTNKLIDNLYNIRYSPIYVYAGFKNVKHSIKQQLYPVALYERYLGSPYLIKTRIQDTNQELRVIDTEEGYQSTCPYMQEIDGTVSVNCTNLSAPAEALSYILDRITYIVNPFYPQLRYVHLQPLWSFNQTEFTNGLEYPGLDEIGYFYVPHQCQNKYRSYGGKPCLLHIYFHGCNQGREFQGTSHVIKSNYLQIAELNRIIMVFPQVLSSEKNPFGCWDIVGFSGPSYATKIGSQVQAIWRMVERVLYLPPENPKPYSTSSYPTPSTSYSTNYYRASGSKEKQKRTSKFADHKMKKGKEQHHKNVFLHGPQMSTPQKLQQNHNNQGNMHKPVKPPTI